MNRPSFLLIVTLISMGYTGCVQDVRQRPASNNPPGMDASGDVDVSEDTSGEDASSDSTTDPCVFSGSPCADENCSGSVFVGSNQGGRFGASLATHDDWLVVGAPGEGVVYVYNFRANNEGEKKWSRIHELRSPSGPETTFGAQVAINEQWLVISEVPVERTSEDPKDVHYVSVAELGDEESPPVLRTISAPNDAQLFGVSLALERDLLYVGHAKKEGGGSGCSSQECGALLSYELTSNGLGQPVVNSSFTLGPDAGNYGAFGTSIAIGQGAIFVSSPRGDVMDERDTGFVSIFFESGPPEAVQIASETSARKDRFGRTLALGDGFLAVGAPATEVEDSELKKPRVEFFEVRDPDAPVHVQTGASGFGSSLSAYGSLTAIGSPDEGNGSVTLLSGALCPAVSTQTFDAPTTGPARFEMYGYALAQSDQWLVVGDPQAVSNVGRGEVETGAVHVIRLGNEVGL